MKLKLQTNIFFRIAMACLEYLLQNFGFNNHGEVEELELFEPRLNIDMTSEELAKKVGCRLCWHQVFYFILAMCVINGYIFIGMIKNPTSNSQSELDWYKESSIYVINIAPLLSSDCKLSFYQLFYVVT